MGFPNRPRCARAHLVVELLEDRTTPAGVAPTLAVPDLAATGAVAADRVNIVMAAETTTASDAAELAGPFAANVRALGFGIYSVTLAPGTDASAAVAYYGALDGVVSAAPDEVVRLQQTPNDTYYTYLYGMTKIAAPTAWDSATGNSSFVVAVIDTGVDYNHPDLAANIWTNPGEIAGNGIDDDGNGYVDDTRGWDFANNDNNPFDGNGHGTHVSGTIGAIGNNSVGVAGVNWSVKIMPLKFLADNGSGSTSGAIAALNYAVNNGAKVSNNSWGGGGYSSALATAISRARDYGHIFVAAAGNAGSNNDTTASYPSNYNYDNVVAVAATDSNDNLASFSNYGATTVDLAAPGVSILSTTPNNTYSYYSGTSMATPHVTGAIALYWGANPTLSYSQVISKLYSSVDTISGLSGKVATGGRLNVGKMFATSPPPDTSGPTVTGAVFLGNSTQLTGVRVTFNEPMDAATFTGADVVSFTRNGTAITNAAYSVSQVTSTTFDISFTPQTVAGNYALTFGPDVRDTAGNQMNQNGNGTAGESPGDQFTATGALVLTVTKTYTSTTAVAIRDNQTVASTIAVGDNVTISDLNVKLNISHTWDSDLKVTLTGPDGTTVTLVNRRGGSGDNFSNTTFDDEASTGITNGFAPFSGTYRPEGLLSAFDGKNASGTWTLKVSDVATYDTGTLNSWSLVVTGTLGGGNGGMSVRALGIPDAPTVPAFPAPTDPVPVVDAAEPIAVSEPIPVEPSAPAIIPAPTRSATAPVPAVAVATLFLSPEGAHSDTALPLNVSVAPAECAAPPTLLADVHNDPFAVAAATLYFPPTENTSRYVAFADNVLEG